MKSRDLGWMARGYLGLLGVAMLGMTGCDGDDVQLMQWPRTPCVMNFKTLDYPMDLFSWGPSDGGYRGAAAQYSQGLVQKCDGTVGAFAVDGIVYDGAGNRIIDLNSYFGVRMDAAETPGIPIAGNKQQFYFVFGARGGSVPQEDETNIEFGPRIYYVRLDVGAFPQGTSPGVELLAAQSVEPGSTDSIDPVGCHTLHFAFSPIDTYNRPRYIYASGCQTIRRYKITSMGFILDEDFSYTIHEANPYAEIFAEAELVETPNRTVLAIPYEVEFDYYLDGTKKKADFVRVLHINDDGIITREQTVQIDNWQDGTTSGLELVDDGKVLFATHTANNIGYADLDNPNPTFVSIPATTTLNFGRTQLEMGPDQKCYGVSGSSTYAVDPRLALGAFTLVAALEMLPLTAMVTYALLDKPDGLVYNRCSN